MITWLRWKYAFCKGLTRAIWYGIKFSNLPYPVMKFDSRLRYPFIPLIFIRKGQWRVNEIVTKFLAWDKEWKLKNGRNVC